MSNWLRVKGGECDHRTSNGGAQSGHGKVRRAVVNRDGDLSFLKGQREPPRHISDDVLPPVETCQVPGVVLWNAIASWKWTENRSDVEGRTVVE